tara:strand:+ start:9988 stop:12516 length:2529 start_codon:yes stop_codon:yes gene_type:complete
MSKQVLVFTGGVPVPNELIAALETNRRISFVTDARYGRSTSSNVRVIHPVDADALSAALKRSDRIILVGDVEPPKSSIPMLRWTRFKERHYNYRGAMRELICTDLDHDELRYFERVEPTFHPVRREGNAGILTAWAMQGLGYHAKLMCDTVEELGYKTFVMSYAIPKQRKSTKGKGLDHPRVTYTPYGRNDLPVHEVVNWVTENRISVLFIAEPVQEGTWRVVEAVKRDTHCKVYLLPMIEIVRESELEKFGMADAVLCHNAVAVEALRGVSNTKYIGWCAEKQTRKRRKAKKATTFFHAAGWGGDRDRKDTSSVVQAFHMMSGAVRLVITSQKKLNRYPEAIKNIVNDDERIEFHEGNLSRAEFSDIMDRCDVAVYPSMWEGLGLPLYEALSHGLPVVTTDAAPMNEIVVHGVTGFICKSYPHIVTSNPEAVIDGGKVQLDDLRNCMELTRDKVWQKRAQKASYDYVDREYSMAAFRERLQTVLPRKRIMFVARYYHPCGGAEKSTRDLLTSLSKRFECCALYFETRLDGTPVANTHEFETIEDGVSILSGVIPANSSISKTARMYIQRFAPDMVITQLDYASAVVGACKDMDVPCMFFVRSISEHFCAEFISKGCHPPSDMSCMKECKHGVTPVEHQQVFDDATYIGTASYFMAGLVKDVYGKDCYAIRPTFKKPEGFDDDIAKEYILLVKGSVEKGLNTIERVALSDPKLKFLSVGGGECEFIDSIPFQHDMERVYERAKLLVAPSIGLEGFGRAPVEAMLRDIPVIASERGGLVESVGEGGVMIADYLDPKKWLKAIRRVLVEPAHRKDLMKRGQHHAKQFVDIDYVPLFVDILREAQ